MKLERQTAAITAAEAIARGLDELQLIVAEINEEKGWNDDDEALEDIDLVDRLIADSFIATTRVNPDKLRGLKARAERWLRMSRLAMIAGEVAEAQEEVRNDRPSFYFKNAAGNRTYGPIRPEDIANWKPEGDLVELADGVVRTLHYFAVHGQGVKFSDVILAKVRYNETRERRHGGKML